MDIRVLLRLTMARTSVIVRKTVLKASKNSTASGSFSRILQTTTPSSRPSPVVLGVSVMQENGGKFIEIVYYSSHSYLPVLCVNV